MNQNNIIKLKSNPDLKGMARLIPDVVFSTIADLDLKMQILCPWREKNNEVTMKRYPLIVFVQGSGWTSPDIGYELPQLGQLAQKGYIVATITHRDCRKGNPFPAFLQDIKTAIRYLRKNADEYAIDTARVGIWGTSSGGNAALLVGMTGDLQEYKTGEYQEYSDSVTLAVDCFGPTNIPQIVHEKERLGDIEEPFLSLLVGQSGQLNMEKAEAMSPWHLVKQNQKFPPFLILHGTKDEIVECQQSEDVFKKLMDHGYQAEMILIENAPHEGSFWSQEVLELIFDFFKRKL